MCMGGGGGGGSDEQLAEQRRIRAEQDKAIAALNELFGIGDPKAGMSLAPAPASGSSWGEMVKTLRYPGTTYYDTKEQLDAAIAERQRKLEATKTQREANYTTGAQDIMNLKTPQLDKQRQKAELMLKDQLARTGQVGGSLAIDQGNELTDNYQRGVLDLNNQKEAAVNTMRASDEQTRIDLINRIRSGMDQASALASAASQAKSNINAARDSALAQNLQDYFSGMGYLYGQNQQQMAYQNKLKQLGYGSGPVADNGTIGRI